jgi:hypothetical protein
VKVITAILLGLLASHLAFAGSVEDYAGKIAPLIDPAKLATVGARGANPRVQKITYWLASAKAENVSPAKVADAALLKVGVTNSAAMKLTKDAMLRNVTIAERLGCLDQSGLDEMRKGHAATVRRGPYAGDELSVDHIIPRAVVAELDNVIANLELLPLRANERKNSTIGQRQRDLAAKLYAAGLLTPEGLRQVRNHR